ncbi:glycoside hydrolase superfamily [Dendryphion nanum]|uniref:chitinase n=1 Tax=Dendryphion nanum TaxID=256645 RepID=A0A9P9EM05_9PLEO|nr:glycoside hydrolase superfamily [Dendryphion nanum]
MRFSTLAVLAPLLATSVHAAARNFVMYYDEWHPSRPTTAEQRAGITHLILAFANSTNPSMYKPAYDIAAVKSEFPKAKIMVAIGGWDEKQNIGFRKAIATDASLDAWATDVKALVTNGAFDGIDIDWEYPGGSGDLGPGPDAALEIKRFPELLAAVRKAIGKDKILSIAVPGKTKVDFSAYTSATSQAINASVDFVNLMTYDLMNRRGDEDNKLKTTHHSSLKSSLAVVNYYLSLNYPPAKLNLGFAYYAKYFTTASGCTQANPLGCSILAAESNFKDTKTSGVWTFEAKNMKPPTNTSLSVATDAKCGPDVGKSCPAGNCCSSDGWCGATDDHCLGTCWYGFGDCKGPDIAKSWQYAASNGMVDQEQGGKYAFDPSSNLFWTWDTEELMKKKVDDIVKAKNLGGGMAWSMGEDSDGWKHTQAIAKALAT